VHSVWRSVDKRLTAYVPRCSKCGGFKEDLKEHWFYSGIYCVDCIRYTLYDDTKVPYYGGSYES